MTKKSGKSLKAKRAEKRAKDDRQTSTEATLHFKNHLGRAGYFDTGAGGALPMPTSARLCRGV
jgi:hypothetical protein